MVDLTFLLPGDSDSLTGGTLYDKRMVEGLRAAGWRVDLQSLPGAYPAPDGAALEAARSVLAGLPDGAAVVIDGLAYGALPEIAGAEAARLRLIALVHHPLALETGLAPERRAALFAQERAALAAAARVVVTSASTARGLADYGVAASRIGVVLPGTDPAPLAPGSGGPALRLLVVAHLTPRKGHAVLIDALAGLRDRAWQLSCVGSRTRDRKTADRLAALIADRGLQERIELAGEVAPAALEGHYAKADLFVLASHHEGYGMAFAEALARGLPVVGTTAGAIPDTVPAAAGLLVPPGDPEALTRALARLFDEDGLRASLAAGARAARRALPAWPAQAARFMAEVARVQGT